MTRLSHACITMRHAQGTGGKTQASMARAQVTAPYRTPQRRGRAGRSAGAHVGACDLAWPARR